MKQLLLILSILIPGFVFGQIPNINPRNIQLLYQTTGDGIVWRGGANIDYTPTTKGNAWMHLDTVNNKLYSYVQGQWSLVKAGGVTNVYMGNDTLYITTSDTVFYTVITPDSLQYNNTAQVLSIRNGNSVTLAMNTDTTLSGDNTLASKLKVNNTYVPMFKDTLTSLATKANVALSLNAADTIKYVKYVDTLTTIGTKANLALKLNSSDTSKYVKYADTLTTISTKANLALKLNASDTSKYVKFIDTLTTIGTKANLSLKLNLTDTASVILTAQQKQLAYIKNQTGSPLTRGQVVYVSGASGDNKLVSLASSSNEATSSKTFGVVSDATIANGSNGYVITFGLLEGVNTDTFQAGAVLYLHTVSGQITDEKPVAPLHMVVIGFCVRSQQNTGAIFVKIQNGFELDELHNVLDTMKVDKSVLYYDQPSNLWKASLTPGLIAADTTTSIATKANLALKLNATDTVSLSNRINTKQDIITGAATTVTTSNLTASRALISNSAGKIAVSPNVDSTELSYLDGVTSAIQTQLNNKQGTLSLTTTGSSGASTLVGSTLNIPNYTLSGLGGEPAITAGTTSQYWRGDKSWQTLNTTAVTEGTNLYFTNARARDAITLTTNNSSGAATYSGGVLNIPNYTLSGLGGISLTSLSASAPLSYSNTTGAFSITQANGSTNGFLSSTDWNTFNNKQAQLNGTGFVKASGTNITYDNNTYLTTEVDGSVTNEGTLGVDAGTSTTAVITSNTSNANGVTIAQGTGIAVTETISSNGGTVTITNSAPDQTVALTGSGATTVTGTYPNFTIGSQNLYTANGNLTDNTRVVGIGSKNLIFSLSNFTPATDSMNIAMTDASGLTITNTGSTILPQFIITSISQGKEPVISLVRSMNVNQDKNLSAYDPVTNNTSLGSIHFGGAYNTSGTALSSYITAQATSNWTTDANNYSKLIFATKGSTEGTITTKMEIGDNGRITFNKYGANNITGTPVSFLGVDASGNVINRSPTTLSGYGITDAVPSSRTITINGTAFDLTADRSWTINSMVYPSAGIAVSTGSAWGTSIVDNSTNWNTAYTDRLKWDGGSTGLTPSTGRTSLGATTIGSNMFTLANPSAVTFPRFNADNTISALSASDMRAALGAGTANGTINYLPKFTSSTAIGNSVVFENNSTDIGINTNNPQGVFDVVQPSFTGSGTVSTSGSVINGVNTNFLSEARINGTITIGAETRTIKEITSDIRLVLVSNFGSAYSGQPYTLSGGNNITVKKANLVGINQTQPQGTLHLKTGDRAIILENITNPINSTTNRGSVVYVTEAGQAINTTTTANSAQANTMFILAVQGASTKPYENRSGPRFEMIGNLHKFEGQQNTTFAGNISLSAGQITAPAVNEGIVSIDAGAATGNDTGYGINSVVFGNNKNAGFQISNSSVPSYSISLGGNKSREIGVLRNMINTNNGQSLTIVAGAPTLNSSNKLGGDLILSSGTATGTGSSKIEFQTASASTSSDTDNTPTTKMAILGNGSVNIGGNYAQTTNTLNVTGTGNFTGALSANSLSLSTPLPIGSGGTGQSTQQTALNALAGSTASGQYLRGNGTNVVMSAIQAADVPNLDASKITTGLLPVDRGGTNLGSYTANGILYASSTSQVATTSLLTYANTANGRELKLTENVDAGVPRFKAQNSENKIIEFGIWGPSTGAFGAILANNAYIYGSQDFATAVQNDMGSIKWGIGVTPTERMRLTTTGLGIGASTPSSRFHIKQPINDHTGGIKLEKFSGTNTYSMNVDASDNLNIGYAAAPANSPTNLVTVTSAGRVGIGTSSVTTGFNMQISGSNSRLAMLNSSANNTSNYSQMLLGHGVNSDQYAEFYRQNNTKQFSIFNSNGDIFFSTNYVINYRYDLFIEADNGNVGIGTDSPQNKLDIEGAVAIGVNYSGSASAPTNGLIVEGSVGIGTSTPTSVLQIADAGSTEFNNKPLLTLNNPQKPTTETILNLSGFSSNWSSSPSGWTLTSTAAGSNASGTLTYTGTNFVTANVCYLVELGIAGYSGSGTLIISMGDRSAETIQSGAFFSTVKATVGCDRNLPISTITNGFKITGVSFTGTIQTVTVKAIRNPYKSNLTATQSGSAASDKFELFGMGNQILLGSNVPKYLMPTDGVNNIVMGADAGKNLIDGANNVFIGNQAAYDYVGKQASFNGGNIAIGANSSYRNRSGYRNITIGENSGYSNNGDENIFIGYNAGYAGTPSTVISNTSKNLFIGNEAGKNIAATATSNIVIGSCDLPITTNSQQLVIGNLIFGKGVNTASTIGASNIALVGIRTNNPTRTLDVDGDLRIRTRSNTPTSIIGVDADGVVGAITLGAGLTLSSGQLSTSSDVRIKTDIKPLEGGIDIVNKLNPVYFNIHKTIENDGKFVGIDSTDYTKALGFIAQEVVDIVPEAVTPGSEDKIWNMDYNKIIPILTKAIQEQQAIIEELKARIIKLENK